METFAIEADAHRRILRTYFRGIVTAERLKLTAEPSARLIEQMQPGFTVLADLTGLEEMEIECVPHITGLMDRFRRAGVKRVVRVIPDPAKDIGFTLLSHTHYRGTVPFHTVRSLHDAERLLAEG